MRYQTLDIRQNQFKQQHQPVPSSRALMTLRGPIDYPNVNAFSHPYYSRYGYAMHFVALDTALELADYSRSRFNQCSVHITHVIACY